MRLNIYGEELTDDVELIEKTSTQGDKFFGVRMYLQSPDALHHTAFDDDRSAVTIWVPWTKAGGHETKRVQAILNAMHDALDSIK